MIIHPCTLVHVCMCACYTFVLDDFITRTSTVKYAITTGGYVQQSFETHYTHPFSTADRQMLLVQFKGLPPCLCAYITSLLPIGHSYDK